MTKKPASTLTVIKLGGSVLTGREGIVEAAAAVAARAADPATRLLVVVSARLSETDSLLAEAHAISATPDDAALDLLWSTGELRSVALLTLALKTHDIDAVGLNVHEAGLRAGDEGASLNPIALRAALARHSVVVVPGFLATNGHRVVTLGRGGSDLSAVLLAILLRADRCELVKDVDGYFTADPHADPAATLIPSLDFPAALELADEGCPLVQKQALISARDANLPIVVRSLRSEGTTVGGHARDFLASRLSDFRSPVVF
jgi:aspartate kinase